jgi:predicted helicase
LDPAAGTATFLYFVVQHIYEALRTAGQHGGWNDYVAQHLLPRLFGFELLMAPYAIAHLKLGILLQETGYAFHGHQRLGVYLTNTLDEAVLHEGLPGFGRFIAEEANAAAEVKRDKDILVVLGNPPYAGHSANRSWAVQDGKRADTFIGRLLRDYYRVDGRPLGEKNPKWLQDDYVKFIRWGQWRIERTGQGILAFITNHGYLDNPTFRGMRQSLMQTFSDIYLLDLHGNAKKKETAPDGGKDENVFDIQQGVAVALFVKRPGVEGPAAVRHADLWGVRDEKYACLFAHDVQTTDWQPLRPQPPFYLFAPQDTDRRAEYERSWKVTDAMPVNVLGFQTHRDAFAVDFDRERLSERIREMRDTRLSDAEFSEAYPEAGSADWNLRESRETLRCDSGWERRFIRCTYRPFDWRWGYYNEAVMDRPRRELKQHVAGRDNICLNTVRQTKMGSWQHALVSDSPTPAVFVEIKDGSSVFPLYLYPDPAQLIEDWQWPAGRDGRRPNLAPAFVRDAEARLGLAFVPDGRGDLHTTFGPEDVFHYICAVLHSPTYRQRYAEFLKIDFPRVPLTSDRELFRVLAEKGAQLVALHLLQSPLLNSLITTYPVVGDSEVVHVRYAPPGQDAKGKPTPGRVYINTEQYFEGVPPQVWEFRVGGYQVLEKWLKDRQGRRLSFDDLMHYQKVVVALKETMRLMAEIDAAIPGWPVE